MRDDGIGNRNNPGILLGEILLGRSLRGLGEAA